MIGKYTNARILTFTIRQGGIRHCVSRYRLDLQQSSTEHAFTHHRSANEAFMDYDELTARVRDIWVYERKTCRTI